MRSRCQVQKAGQTLAEAWGRRNLSIMNGIVSGGGKLPKGICSVACLQEALKNPSKKKAIHPDTKDTGQSSNDSRISTYSDLGALPVAGKQEGERRQQRECLEAQFT